MKTIIKILGIVLILSGIALLIKPAIILDWIEVNKAGTSLYAMAILVRLTFGILLIMTASKSRYPGAINALAYLAIIAAIAFIAMGHERFKNFFDTIIPVFKDYAPLTGLLAAVIGGFLIFAFQDNDKLA